MLLFSCKKKHAESFEKYQLVWADEFDGNDVNPDNWNFVIWDAGRVNNEWQKYVKDTTNYKIEDGKLTSLPQKLAKMQKEGILRPG